MQSMSTTILQDLSLAYDLVPPVAQFALPHQGVNNTTIGIRAGNGDFVWKTYIVLHDRASLDYEHRLLRWLARQRLSFSLPLPLPNRDGELITGMADSLGALVQYCPGVLLDPCRDQDVEELGAALGALHQALAIYPQSPRPGRTLFGALFDFPAVSRAPLTLTPQDLGLPPCGAHDTLLGWWRDEAARLQELVEGPYRRLPWQICHNDVTPKNVLVLDAAVRAVLDWEFACPAPRALDLAMSLRMTMRPWENASPWEAATWLCRGYRRWGALCDEEIAMLPWLIRLRCAVVVLWWLGRMTCPDDATPVLRAIDYARNFGHWAEEHGDRLVETVAAAMR